MKKSQQTVPLLLIALGLLSIVVGCSTPPEKEMMDAENAMKAAANEGADKYAEQKFKEANQSMSEAKTKMEAKDYKGAHRAFLVAQAKFEAASAMVPKAKEEMKGEVDGILADVETGITEMESTIQKMRLSKKERAKMTEMVNEIKNGRDAAKIALEGGDLLGAKEKAAEAKNSLDSIAQTAREKQS